MDNKWTPKRICALLVVILLVMMYLVTLFVAVIWPGNSAKLFAMCLLVTVIVPIVAYIYLWLYGTLTGKRTIASSPEVEGEEEARKALSEMNAEGDAESSGSDSETP